MVVAQRKCNDQSRQKEKTAVPLKNQDKRKKQQFRLKIKKKRIVLSIENKQGNLENCQITFQPKLQPSIPLLPLGVQRYWQIWPIGPTGLTPSWMLVGLLTASINLERINPPQNTGGWNQMKRMCMRYQQVQNFLTICVILLFRWTFSYFCLKIFILTSPQFFVFSPTFPPNFFWPFPTGVQLSVGKELLSEKTGKWS